MIKYGLYLIMKKIYIFMNLFSTYATNSYTRYEKYYELDYQNEELKRIEKLEINTLVLPEPAPATIKSGPSRYVTASF